MATVAQMLNEKHPDKYMVWNLSEEEYNRYSLQSTVEFCAS